MSELKEIIKEQTGRDSSKKSISYSQATMYYGCQYKWYLTYVLKKGTYEANIHLIFGSAMHTALQLYLYVVYNGTVAEADNLNIEEILLNELKKEFSKAKEDSGVAPATKEDLMEFYQDGVEILRWFKKHRGDYFSKKGYELIGYEIPLYIELQKNLQFVGYIDIVLRDVVANRILIKDFKTSTRGWNEYQKKDETKTQQMVLYKKFYADKFDIPVENIDIEYIILKRKLYENALYPQKRIQKFSPPSGKPTINKVMTNLNEFINNCFTDDGQYKENRTFFKNASDKNCRFCEFKDRTDLCNKTNQ